MTPPTLRALYSAACHGAGAEPRIEARLAIREMAQQAGVTKWALLRDAGLDLTAYFASKPLSL